MPSQSLGDALTKANPNNLADALRMVNLGQFFKPVAVTLTFPPGTIEVPLDPPALTPAAFVCYALVANSKTGTYIATSGNIVAASAADIGACQMSADGTTVLFPDEVSSVQLRYIAAPAKSLDSSFAFASP